MPALVSSDTTEDAIADIILESMGSDDSKDETDGLSEAGSEFVSYWVVSSAESKWMSSGASSWSKGVGRSDTAGSMLVPVLWTVGFSSTSTVHSHFPDILALCDSRTGRHHSKPLVCDTA